MNDDFSFVRFLKVVKTLYESSTFTQLGKTVGSALGPLSSNLEKPDVQRGGKDDDDVIDHDDHMGGAINRSGSNIFDALAAACSPAGQSSRRSRKKKGAMSPSRSEAEDEKKDDTLSPHGETLFERVINCTLIGNAEEEYSDEDTLKTRTNDYYSYEGSYTEGGSYESMTDDDESHGRDRRRRR